MKEEMTVMIITSMIIKEEKNRLHVRLRKQNLVSSPALVLHQA